MRFAASLPKNQLRPAGSTMNLASTASAVLLLLVVGAAMSSGCRQSAGLEVGRETGVRGFAQWTIEGRAKLVTPAMAQGRRVLLVLDWDDLHKEGRTVVFGRTVTEIKGTELANFKYELTFQREGEADYRHEVEITVRHDLISLGTASSSIVGGKGAIVFATIGANGLSPTMEVFEIRPDATAQEAHLMALGLMASRSPTFGTIGNVE